MTNSGCFLGQPLDLKGSPGPPEPCGHPGNRLLVDHQISLKMVKEENYFSSLEIITAMPLTRCSTCGRCRSHEHVNTSCGFSGIAGVTCDM